MLNLKTLFFASGISLAAIMMSWASSAAGDDESGRQDEYRARVYGMVCNQCAYGVEQTLQHTKGVLDAIVDLKAGSVVARVSAEPPAVETVVRKIKDQRVSVESIEATLTGRIERTGNGFALAAGTERIPLVSAGTDHDVSLDERYEGSEVRVLGEFQGIVGVDGAEGPARLVVHKIQKK